MGYLHIDNLYKNQTVLLFKECWALEKVHGTSAHVRYKDDKLTFFSGGEKHENFVKLFDHDALLARFRENGYDDVTVYGEAYGGKQQAMMLTYGQHLCFIAFDVRSGDEWLDVPAMDAVARKLGFEVVPFERCTTDVAVLDAIRDRPSDVAERRGCGTDKMREGIVIRPIVEFTEKNGSRVIAKHKGDAFRERVHVPKVDEGAPELLRHAALIAHEWVTDMRVRHVLDKLYGAGGELAGMAPEKRHTGAVIAAVLDDVLREGAGEFEDSDKARGAIKGAAVKVFHRRLAEMLRESAA